MVSVDRLSTMFTYLFHQRYSLKIFLKYFKKESPTWHAASKYKVHKLHMRHILKAVPKKPYGFCGPCLLSYLHYPQTELRSCLKVKTVDVLGSRP